MTDLFPKFPPNNKKSLFISDLIFKKLLLSYKYFDKDIKLSRINLKITEE